MSFFNWSTMCMDVGPGGFMIPKRPDSGNDAGDLGIASDPATSDKSPVFDPLVHGIPVRDPATNSSTSTSTVIVLSKTHDPESSTFP